MGNSPLSCEQRSIARITAGPDYPPFPATGHSSLFHSFISGATGVTSERVYGNLTVRATGVTGLLWTSFKSSEKIPHQTRDRIPRCEFGNTRTERLGEVTYRFRAPTTVVIIGNGGAGEFLGLSNGIAPNERCWAATRIPLFGV